MSVIDAIPFGKDNAITRQRLVELTGLPDRQIRKHIEEARAQGEIIINDGDGRGYYRSDDLDEIERQYRQDTNRAMAILIRRKFLRRRLKAAGRAV